MKKKYRIIHKKNQKMVDELNRMGIKYKDFYPDDPDIIFVATEDQYRELKRKFPLIGGLFSLNLLVLASFSTDEILSSEYLSLSCTNLAVDYIMYDDDGKNLCVFDWECEYRGLLGIPKHHHEYHKKPFIIERVPHKKNKYIFADGYEDGWLFVNDEFKAFIQNNNFSGIQFLDVYLENNKKTDQLYEIRAIETIPNEFVSLQFSNKIKRCKKCGRKILLYGDLLDDPMVISKTLSYDFYQTERMFGIWEFPQYIISQRLYRALKENHMLSGCSVIPVILSKE